LNVVIVTEYFYPHLGGVTEHVHHLSGHAARAGHRVRLVTNHVVGRGLPRLPDREWLEQGGGRYEVWRMGHGMPIESNGSVARITVGTGLGRKMREALADADVVHIHSPLFPVLATVALKAARQLGVPTVGTLHTHFGAGESASLRVWSRLLLPYTHAIDFPIAVSESAARSARPFLRTDAELIPNGVDTAAWSAGRRRPELDDGKRGIAFLGRLEPRNDVDVVVAAFAEVAAQRPDVRLILVGDGPGRAAIEASLSPALRSRVVLAGAQSEVSVRADFLASAHVLAFTARMVSHPMALTEGLAAGLPVVCYDIEGVRDMITDGREGYKVATGDRAALARRMLQLLDDEAARRVMGRNAQARAAAYDWSIISERVFDVWHRATGVPRAEEPRIREAKAL
jgi:phosphatidylinositol alpha-mannosyltransferase